MKNRWACAVALMLVACPAPKEPEPMVHEMDEVAPRPRGAKSLEFTITKIHDTPPLPTHGATGDSPIPGAPTGGNGWTFFDATAGGATFTAGVRVQLDPPPFTFGLASISVANSDEGRAFVEAFERAFSVRGPSPRKGEPPEPLLVEAVHLGKHVAGLDSLLAGKTGWFVTKWFVIDEERQGEIYFIFDLESRRGEFVEYEAGHTQNIATTFAQNLRDGPPLERTPKTDPGLTDAGPKIESWRKITHQGRVLAVVADRVLVFNTKEGLRAYDFETSEDKVLPKLPGIPSEFACRTRDLSQCFMTITPRTGQFVSLDARTSVYELSGTKLARLDVPHSKGHSAVLAGGMSKDGDYLMVSSGFGETRREHLYDTKARKWLDLSAPQGATFVAWERDWLVFGTGGKFDPPDSRKFFECRPKERRWRDYEGRGIEEQATIWLDPAEIAFERGDARVSFKVHPDDAQYVRRGCCEFLNERYALFQTHRTGIIDLRTSKMNYLQKRSDDLEPYFTADVRFAYAMRDHQIYVAQIDHPAD